MMETDSSSFTSRSSPEGSRSGALNAKASPTSLPILGAYAGKRSNISTDRRREINRESARRIRAKKLAEASSLRDKTTEQERIIQGSQDQINLLRAENSELLKQNTRLVQQNMLINEDLRCCLASRGNTQGEGGRRDFSIQHAVPPAIFAEEDITTPLIRVPLRGSLSSGLLSELAIQTTPFAPRRGDNRPSMVPGAEAGFGTMEDNCDLFLPMQDFPDFA